MKAIFVSFNQAYYEKVDHFLEILHQMDQKTEAQGLRAFVWNIEKTI